MNLRTRSKTNELKYTESTMMLILFLNLKSGTNLVCNHFSNYAKCSNYTQYDETNPLVIFKLKKKKS